MSKIVTKVWGSETILVDEENYCLKMMRLSYGKQCSLHKHDEKDETFLLLQGVMTLEKSVPFTDIKEANFITQNLSLKLVPVVMLPGDTIRIPPNTYHRFINNNTLNTKECIFLEVSTKDDQEDCFRLTESS